MAKPYRINPRVQAGAWQTKHHQYYRYLGILLSDLETCLGEILASWPAGEGDTIGAAKYPQVARLCTRRDAISDSIALFAAIAVESAINYYGVLRFGEDVFHAYFERRSTVEKLRIILLFCDNLDLESGDTILTYIERIAQRRNVLAHPKAKDVSKPGMQVERAGPVLIDAAREAIADCGAFFDALMALVPDATGLDPRK